MSDPSLTGAALGRILRERGKVVEFGDVILTFARASSTNEIALAYARKGLPHGSVILADQQTAGRGRRGRVWVSPARLGLYLTALLRPPKGQSPAPHLLPLAASVAAAEALRDCGDEAVRALIRWPNDLYVGGRKLAGILCEATFSGALVEHLAIGVGINVNQETSHFGRDLADRATSLRLITGREHARLDVAACLIERLEHWWDRSIHSDTRGILARWGELAEGAHGMRVVVERDGASLEATTAGLAEDGGLRVSFSDGRVLTLYSAEEVSVHQTEA